MSHEEFVLAYRQGSVRVQVDRAAAARLVSARLMLPLVLLPFLGLGVGLALVGYVFTGVAVFVATIALRYAIRSTSQNFVLKRALEDPAFYAEVIHYNVLRMGPVE